MALFTILLTSGDSITVDGEFDIDSRSGVLTVTRPKPPHSAINPHFITTHFSPAAWVSVEAVGQRPIAAHEAS